MSWLVLWLACLISAALACVVRERVWPWLAWLADHSILPATWILESRRAIVATAAILSATGVTLAVRVALVGVTWEMR